MATQVAARYPTTQGRPLERPKHVEVTTARGTAVIAWPSRQALLARLSNADGAEEARSAFEAAGATLPVILTLDQQGVIVRAINKWRSELDGGFDELPEGIVDLYNALADPFDPSVDRSDEAPASGLRRPPVG